MAYTRLPMRKIKEVLRLKHEQGLSQRSIARSCGIAQSTVVEYLQRADKAGIGWPLPESLTETELERRLFLNSASPDPDRPLAESACPFPEEEGETPDP